MSESGFISESTLLDYSRVLAKEDYGQLTSVPNSRTTLNWGNRQSIGQLASEHYELPIDVVGNSTLFGYYVWLTQIQQGKCMQYLFENQRRHRPNFNTLTGQLGGYGSMGGVYWQYNNNWPTVSWATLDHSGNWKMSHYMVEQMNKDVMVTSYFQNNVYHAHIVNDRHDEDLIGVKMTVETFLYNQQDSKSQSKHELEINVTANSAQ